MAFRVEKGYGMIYRYKDIFLDGDWIEVGNGDFGLN